MENTLQPLDVPRRADGVFDQLRSKILTGAYPAGSRLPTERELALALRVNRSSAREALKRLEFLELIEIRHGQGAFVCGVAESSAPQVIEALLREPYTITCDLLRQLLEFRRHTVLHVVELAAKNRTDAQIECARSLLYRETAEGADPKSALEIDIEMNTLLGAASGNLMYQTIVNLFTKLVQRLGPLYYNENRDSERSMQTHRALLMALEKHDAASAVEIVTKMLDYSEESILASAAALEEAGMIGPRAEPAS